MDKQPSPQACQICGREFKQRGTLKKFCSDKCRQKAFQKAKTSKLAEQARRITELEAAVAQINRREVATKIKAYNY